MDLRLTAAMVALALVAAIVVVLDPFGPRETDRTAELWFYQIAVEDIESIQIAHGRDEVAFSREPGGRFVFGDPPGIPPDTIRFSGVPLLVSGPRAVRELAVDTAPAALEQYGLADPSTVLRLEVSDGGTLELRLGGLTSDGSHQYGRLGGAPNVYLVDSSWGEVLVRLAEDPPLPKWYVERDLEDVVGLDLYAEASVPGDPPELSFSKRDGIWMKRSEGETTYSPADGRRWAATPPLLRRAAGAAVATLEGDGAAYGVREESPAIELRFLNVSPRGTTFIDSVRWNIGDKTADGLSYYATVDAESGMVLTIDAVWTETLLALIDEPP